MFPSRRNPHAVVAVVVAVAVAGVGTRATRHLLPRSPHNLHSRFRTHLSSPAILRSNESSTKKKQRRAARCSRMLDSRNASSIRYTQSSSTWKTTSAVPKSAQYFPPDSATIRSSASTTAMPMPNRYAKLVDHAKRTFPVSSTTLSLRRSARAASNASATTRKKLSRQARKRNPRVNEVTKTQPQTSVLRKLRPRPLRRRRKLQASGLRRSGPALLKVKAVKMNNLRSDIPTRKRACREASRAVSLLHDAADADVDAPARTNRLELPVLRRTRLKIVQTVTTTNGSSSSSRKKWLQSLQLRLRNRAARRVRAINHARAIKIG